MILNSSGLAVKSQPAPRIRLIPRAAALAMQTQQLMHRVGLVGKCSDSGDDTHFPPEPAINADPGEFAAYEDYAREACFGCPVIQECRELHNRIERRPGIRPHGIAGGLAPWERVPARIPQAVAS